MVSEEPLTEEDLMQLVEVQLVNHRRARNLDANIFEVEAEGKRYRFGTISEEAFKSVLAHGRKAGNRVVLRIPKFALKEEGASWINEPY